MSKPLFALGVALALLVAASSVAIYVSTFRADLRQVDLDVSAAATWELSHGDLGQVSAVVIDECANAGEKAARYRRWCDKSAVDIYEMLCPAALRGALRFYGDLGGPHGCAQVRRALLAYPSPGDEAALRAAAKCRSK
jgi:hypothetical protein